MLSNLIILLLTWHLHQALGFSTPLRSNDIKIVGLPGGQIQSLPGMYVETFQRWIVRDVVGNEQDECTLQIEPIVGAGNANDQGWVNPTTTNELWWPRDLSSVQTRPMLNVLFKGGVLSYISMGLDVRVPQIDKSGNIVTWRNYGLKSQPIARQWTTLDIAMEKLFHVEGFIVHNQKEESEDETINHQELFGTIYVEPVLEQVANFIGQMDESSPLTKGFHIVSFPMSKYWLDLPIPEENDDSEGEMEPAFKLVCLATSEPFASKLLDLDEGLLEMSSTSVLEVEVLRTEEGGKSQYLPEVYKQLYLNND